MTIADILLSNIVMLMLMHEGCDAVKCGSTTCRNYNGTCDGGRILVIQYKSTNQSLNQLAKTLTFKQLKRSSISSLGLHAL